MTIQHRTPWSPAQLFADGKGDGEWGEMTQDGYRIRRFENGTMISEELHPVPNCFIHEPAQEHPMTDFETNPRGTIFAMHKLREERDALLEQVVYWRECATEVKAERDALGRMVHDKAVKLQRAANAENERDALAAHVEELRYLRKDVLEQDCHELLDTWLESTPAASLTKLKAQWQADAVSDYASRHLGGTEQELAEIYAAKLRQLSEGE